MPGVQGTTPQGTTSWLVRPRLENISWSLYWKEPLSIDTRCLADMRISVADLAELTGAQLLTRVAQAQRWQPVDKLQRIKGFTDPWERLICR